jgi:hypothetical protein
MAFRGTSSVLKLSIVTSSEHMAAWQNCKEITGVYNNNP